MIRLQPFSPTSLLQTCFSIPRIILLFFVFSTPPAAHPTPPHPSTMPTAARYVEKLVPLIFFSFLRSVSYREFSRLVYGMLGNKRISLPACAYVAIRKEFPVEKDESYAGFDLNEEFEED